MSTNVLILGAGGQITRVATDLFLKNSDVCLTLYLRKTQRLGRMNSERVRVVEGDVLDLPTLTANIPILGERYPEALEKRTGL